MNIYHRTNLKTKCALLQLLLFFDGHDAAINIMRRIIQATGCEVIHLGHDRSVEEVVNCAIEEDANAIAMTSYQWGHSEYLKYMYDLLQEKGAFSYSEFLPAEVGPSFQKKLKNFMPTVSRGIYHPDDGRAMGLQGMINDLVKQADYPTGKDADSCLDDLSNVQNIAKLISAQKLSRSIQKNTRASKSFIRQIKNTCPRNYWNGGSG